MFDDNPIIKKIAIFFGVSVDCLHTSPIRDLSENNVWKIEIGQNTFALKQHFIHTPIGECKFTPFEIESKILKVLKSTGCSVPKIIWQSEKDQSLLIEWCGNQTLDDMIQKSRINWKATVSHAILQFYYIEKAFQKSQDDLTPYVFPVDQDQQLQGILGQCRKIVSYIVQSSERVQRTNHQKRIDLCWNNISNYLFSTQKSLGSLDHNTHNILINQQKTFFIDFASIGWNWQAKRLVQSFNSLGANQPGGNFVSLINQEIIEACMEISGQKQANADIDLHNLLFYLSIIHRILRATSRPNHPDSVRLRKAWGNLKTRLDRAINIIIKSNLSNYAEANTIRQIIADCWLTKNTPE